MLPYIASACPLSVLLIGFPLRAQQTQGRKRQTLNAVATPYLYTLDPVLVSKIFHLERQRGGKVEHLLKARVHTTPYEGMRANPSTTRQGVGWKHTYKRFNEIPSLEIKGVQYM